MSHPQYLEPLSERVMRWALAVVAVSVAVLLATAAAAVLVVVIRQVL